MACGKKGATETPSEPTTTEPTTTDPGKGSTTQIANPASVNCIDKGGTLEIVDAPEGQHGICTLKDGTKCEEWAYMRGECPPAAGAPETSAEPPATAPAE